MNAVLPASPPELPPSLLRAVIALEPELGRLMRAADLEEHLTRYVRELRRTAERDALARKDVVT